MNDAILSENLGNRLLGTLIGLARATENNEDLITSETDSVILQGLIAAMSDTDAVSDAEQNAERRESLINRAENEKKRLVPNCYYCASPCGRTENYDIGNLQNESEEVRELKLRLLSGIEKAAKSVYEKSLCGSADAETVRFFYTALYFIGMDCGKTELEPVLEQLEKLAI